MAGSSDSDDASDIFWPGYVDAVTNLAINLLFVIAVMAIVVNMSVLELGNRPEAGAYLPRAARLDTAVSDSVQAMRQLEEKIVKVLKDESATVKQLKELLREALDVVRNAEKAMKEMLSQATQLQKKLMAQEQKLKGYEEKYGPLPDKAKSASGSGTQEKTLSPEEVQRLQAKVAELEKRLQAEQARAASAEAKQKTEVVQAQQKRVTANAASAPRAELQDISGGGVVVAFATDVIELSDAEAADLLKKLANLGPVKGTRWELRVLSPKGFSEAARLAYYRLNSVRNALIKNGASAADLEMRVIETDAASANNARVLVRLMP